MTVPDTTLDTQTPQLTRDSNAGISDLMALATPPIFDDKMKEREYLKERLAAAFRIFGKFGFDHHVVITLILYALGSLLLSILRRQGISPSETQ